MAWAPAGTIRRPGRARILTVEKQEVYHENLNKRQVRAAFDAGSGDV